jgi:hypothetical protein
MDPVRLRMTGWSYATAANRGYGLPGKMRGFVRGDPVADQIKWGIDALQKAALEAGKPLKGDANADVV